MSLYRTYLAKVDLSTHQQRLRHYTFIEATLGADPSIPADPQIYHRSTLFRGVHQVCVF